MGTVHGVRQYQLVPEYHVDSNVMTGVESVTDGPQLLQFESVQLDYVTVLEGVTGIFVSRHFPGVMVAG